jgi:plasmid stabilization system protein ParE
MTRRLIFRPESEAELSGAIEWYEARGKGLGSEFLRALEAAVAKIERHPVAYPVVFGTARRAPVRRFPYSIIYTVADKEILILACFHGRRDPQRWKERVRQV